MNMVNAVYSAESLERADLIGKMLEQLRASSWLPEKDQGTDLSNCLPALFHALKISLDVSNYCEVLPYKQSKIETIDILNGLANLGYISNSASLRLCDLDPRLFPCFFIPAGGRSCDMAAMVVMDKVTAENGAHFYEVFDSATEKVVTISADLRHKGVAHFFYKETEKTHASAADVRKTTNTSWFTQIISRFHGIFWQVFAISIILGMVSLAAPLFVMLVYDRVINAHSPETLSPLIVGALLALATEVCLRTVRTSSLAWFSARLDNIVSNKIFERLMLLPAIFTERAGLASQIARLKAFETTREFFGGPLFLAIIEVPFTIVLLIAIGFIAGYMVFVPITGMLLYCALFLVMRPRLLRAIKISSQASSSRMQKTIEGFERMNALRANGMARSYMGHFREESGKASLSSFQVTFLASIVETLSHSLTILAGVATLVVGIELVLLGNMTTGALIASMILGLRVLSPFQTVCTSIPRLEQLRNAIGQVNRLINIRTEQNNEEIKPFIGKIKGHVSFSNVGLRYLKEHDPVFTGLTFEAEPGQMVAIIGGNGVGKSTILKLTNGLYRPQTGTVRIDGVNIRQLDPINLRKQIAYVAQEPRFFQGSIAENLRLSEPLASDQQLIDVLEEVDALQAVTNLPDGLDTMMGNGHNKLPALLSYRLNLARAYLKNTSLVLIDELPNAFLNSSSGQSFVETLKKWKGNRTIIMITHRDEFLKFADTAIYLSRDARPFVGAPHIVREKIQASQEGA